MEKKQCKVEMVKNIKFLKGPTTKLKPQFNKSYCEKINKRTFFRLKKSFKLALKKLKIIGFKVWLKNYFTKKSQSSQVYARWQCQIVFFA